MPVFSAKLSDGSTVRIESDQPPTEDEVLQSVDEFEAQSQPAPSRPNFGSVMSSWGQAPELPVPGDLVTQPTTRHPLAPGELPSRDQMVAEETWRELSGPDRLLVDLSRMGAGAIRGAGDVIKGLGIKEQMSRGMLDDPNAMMTPWHLEQLSERMRQSPEERLQAIESDPLVQSGNRIIASGERQFPQVTPESAVRPLGAVAEGIGSTATFLPAAVTGPAAPGIIAMTGALQAGASGYQEAIDSGASLDDAQASFLINAVGGATEAIPISRIFNRINKASGGGVGRALRDMINSGLEESTQEAFQAVLGNAAAKHLYDSERGYLDNLASNAGTGGAVGFLLAGFGLGAGAAARRVGEKRVQAPAPVEAVPPVEAPAAAIDEAAINRGLEQAAVEPPPVPTEPVSPKPVEAPPVPAEPVPPKAEERIGPTASEVGPLQEGDRLVELVHPDGKVEIVAYRDKFYDMGPGKKYPDIARWKNGGWSHGVAIKGEVVREIAEPESSSELAAETATPVETTAEPELISMGGELATAQPTGTTLANASGEQERTDFGLPAAYPKVSRKMLPVWNASAEVLRKDPKAGEKLAAELKINPERGMTDEDSALLLRHKVALENAKNQAAEDSITAGTPEAKQEAMDRFDNISNQLLDLLDAAKFRGSQWGREGRWRQALAFEDYSFESMRRQKRMKADRELTPEEEAETKREYENLAAKQKAAEEARVKDEQSAHEAQAKEVVAETIKTARTRQTRQKAAGVVRDLTAEQTEIVAYLKDHFIENGDLSDTQSSIKKLMELLVEREGITERLPLETRVHEILSEVDPTLTREGTLDLMSGYGKSKLPSQEPAKKIVRDISQQIISVRKLLDYFKGKRPSLTGMLRDAPSDIARAWNAMVYEAKKNFKLDAPEDNARSIKSATDAINTRLKNRISDLKQEIATRQKIIRERSPSPYNAETLKLRQELESLQAQHAEIFGSGLTPAQQLDRLEKSAERQIKELERQIKSGEIFPKSRQVVGLTSDKLDAAKAKIEELKLQRHFAREALQPKMEPHEQFLLNYLLRVRQREAAYKERLAKGEFEKQPKPKRELSPAVLSALADVEKAKSDFQRGLHQYNLSRRSRIQKIWDAIKDTRNAFVNIISSYDFSAPRQAFGAILSNVSRLVTNPVVGSKLLAIPFQRMFQAWSGEQRSATIDQWIKNRPNATSGADKTAGIQYTDLHSETFSKREENARSVLDDWAKFPLRTGNAAKSTVTFAPKIGAKGVRMSNRAFITYLNTTRALLFDELLRANFQDRAPTEAQLKVLGNIVNLSTGRGALNEGVAKVASEILWAPSLLTSRVQLLTGQPFWGKAGREGGGKARLIVAKEYARWITSAAVLFAISRMFDDKDDEEPTSSDFGKVVRGNTRIDPWAGFQQVAVLMARLRAGETTSIEGTTKNISKTGQGEVVWNFFKNKARPDLVAVVKAVIATIDLGKDKNRVRVTQAEAVKSAIPAPLAIREVIEVMRDRGMTEGAIVEALALFGAGVSVYEEREAQK